MEFKCAVCPIPDGKGKDNNLLLSLAKSGARSNFLLSGAINPVALIEGQIPERPNEDLMIIVSLDFTDNECKEKSLDFLQYFIDKSKANSVALISEAWCVITDQELDKIKQIREHPDSKEIISIFYEHKNGIQEIWQADIQRKDDFITLGEWKSIPQAWTTHGFFKSKIQA